MRTCPRCGASQAPGQDYCVECGHALAPARLAARSRSRAWPLLGLLLLASVGALVAIAVSRGEDTELIVATKYRLAKGPRPARTLATTTLATTTLPDVTPIVPLTPTKRVPTPKRRRSTTLTRWTATGGYTVVLASVPSATGAKLARSTARDALAKGLHTVGILDSARFASLHPGYLVVFTGVFDSNADALKRVAEARSLGYAAAYARQITS
jgi:hypothetical protein